MNNVETKIKSNIANKSSQSIAKTLRMFQEMDVKVQDDPTKSTNSTFSLNTEPSNNKNENKISELQVDQLVMYSLEPTCRLRRSNQFL